MSTESPQLLPRRLTTVAGVCGHSGYEVFTERFVRKLIETDRLVRYQPDGPRTKTFVSLDDIDSWIAKGRIEAAS